jgi:hypothetical protein
MADRYRLHLLLLASLQVALVFAGPAEILRKPDESPSKRTSQSQKQSSIVERIWRDPGAVEKLDLIGGPGDWARAPDHRSLLYRSEKVGRHLKWK